MARSIMVISISILCVLQAAILKADNIIPVSELNGIVLIQCNEDDKSISGQGVVVDEAGHIITNFKGIMKCGNIISAGGNKTYPCVFIGHDKKTGVSILKISKGKIPGVIPFAKDVSENGSTWYKAVLRKVTGEVEVQDVSLLKAKKSALIFNFQKHGNNYVIINDRNEFVSFASSFHFKNNKFTGATLAPATSDIIKVADDIRQYGEVRRPSMGIIINTINPGKAKELHLQKQNCVVVEGFLSNSPACKSGIKKDDIILSIDDQTINSVFDVMDYINEKNPGDVVNVKIYRTGKIINIKVELVDQK